MGAENIGMRGGRMHEALRFSEKDPASGWVSPRSEGVRAEEA